MIKKASVLWIFIFVFIVLIGNVGCTNTPDDSTANPPANTGQNGNGGTGKSNNNGNTNHSENPPANTNEEQKKFINKIVALAKEGKIINSEFAIDNSIDDVKNAWGDPDKEEYIADAKGTYCTYEKQGAVFAYNKGLRIFEVRSFDQQLKSLTLEDVKRVLGKPAYDKMIFGNQHHMIGYKINDEDYKLEFVFPKESADHPNPTLDHLNVLDPSGTVNSMKGDPGREW